MVLELAFRFRALVPLTTVELWLGTGDDWIGATDQPLKERGRLGFDTFEASVDGKALRVHDSAWARTIRAGRAIGFRDYIIYMIYGIYDPCIYMHVCVKGSCIPYIVARYLHPVQLNPPTFSPHIPSHHSDKAFILTEF